MPFARPRARGDCVGSGGAVPPCLARGKRAQRPRRRGHRRSLQQPQRPWSEPDGQPNKSSRLASDCVLS